MSLEDVLRILENGKGPRRDPENYHFSIFGTPSDSGTWGYRALVEVYVSNLAPDLAAGGGNQTRRIALLSRTDEFDMTKDNANHIHSVWRGFAGDFGGDALRARYESSLRSENA